MGKQIGRRYKAGEIEAYDKIYNLHRVRSTILNSGNRSVWNMHETSDLTGLKNTLHIYIGDKDGEVKGIDGPALAQIPALKKKLKEVEARFRHYQERKVNNGQPKHEEWPRHLAVEKFKYEALFDVAEAEADWLQKRIKEYESKQQAEIDKRLLKNGPVCKSLGSPPTEIDGQQTGFAKDVLIIKDKRSPYYGMAVLDYRKMASQWIKENPQLRNRRVKRDQLPEWPTGVEKYL